jgi:enoyl-CoA hydratase
MMAPDPRHVPLALPLPGTANDLEGRTTVSTVLNDAVRVERDGALAIVTIDHPPANAISRAVVAGITQALSDAEADSGCRALILTGAGPKFFAAGADITEFGSTGGDTIATGQELTLAMERSRLPIVGAINGIAFGGGCELTLACDVRIASSNARFGQPEIKLGIIPGWGGTQRLPRLIGRTAAMELLLTGDPIDSARALELGLVSRVVEPDALLGAARDIAGRYASQAPLAVAATKRALADGLDRPLREGLEAERREFVGLFSTDDAREGITAFLEKRAANWTGR